MNIQIYADGADLNEMVKYTDIVSGFTTNPTLMRKCGIVDYEKFVKDVIERIPNLPISFEVFSDELSEMERQARKLSTFSNNVYVKIPITNTRGLSTAELIERLLDDGIKVNITAVLAPQQITAILPFIDKQTNAILSIFAGRIADTGINPKPIIMGALAAAPKNVKILWASCREVYNIYEADRIGCHIITVPYDLIDKLQLHNKNLSDYSLDTVKMFYTDAKNCGFNL